MLLYQCQNTEKSIRNFQTLRLLSSKPIPLKAPYRALVIDEAHKLPDAARQMYGQSLSAEDFSELCTLLEKEKYILAAQRLKEKFTALMHRLRFDSGPGSGASGLPFPSSADTKTACPAPSPVDHLISLGLDKKD